MIDSINEKCAVVTGAASGIGRATALILAKNGAKVIVSDVNEQGGLETIALIKKEGGIAHFVPCDVSNRKAVGELMVQAITKFGPIKLAVNNAGIGGVLSPMHEIAYENWDRMMAINLSGVFYCMQEEIKAMLHHRGGNIVNVASIAGLGGVPGGSSYCAAKHGVIGLTKSASMEYAKLGIRVNAVCPGWTETAILDTLDKGMLENSIQNYLPMGRIGQPEEVAETILWLLSEKSSFVNGHCLAIDGGMKAS